MCSRVLVALPIIVLLHPHCPHGSCKMCNTALSVLSYWAALDAIHQSRFWDALPEWLRVAKADIRPRRKDLIFLSGSARHLLCPAVGKTRISRWTGELWVVSAVQFCARATSSNLPAERSSRYPLIKKVLVAINFTDCTVCC